MPCHVKTVSRRPAWVAEVFNSRRFTKVDVDERAATPTNGDGKQQIAAVGSSIETIVVQQFNLSQY